MHSPGCFHSYSTFLVLYPLGVFGELLSCYHALPVTSCHMLTTHHCSVTWGGHLVQVFAAMSYKTDPADVPYFVSTVLLPVSSFVGISLHSILM